MDSQPTPTQGPPPVTTEVGPDPTPTTTPPPKTHAAATEEEGIPSTSEIPPAEQTQNKKESGAGESDSKDDTKAKDSEGPPLDLRLHSWDRERITRHIRQRTGDEEFLPEAVAGFLDVAHAIDLMLKTIAYEEQDSRQKEGRVIAKPEIKRMSWEEWQAASKVQDSGVTANALAHSAVDVLYEEPQVAGTFAETSFLRRSRGSGATAMESRQNSSSKEQYPLPSRISINSDPAKRMLGSIFDINFHPGRALPVVIMRPFKALAIHRREINAKLSEVERIYAERLKDSEVSKTTENVSGTACKDEAHRPANGDNNSTIEDPKEDHSPKTETQSLAQPQTPDAMFTFTGTNWSVLNLSQIKEALDDFRCVASFVNETLQPVQDYLQNEPTSVNFNNLWHLFRTGSLVYVKDKLTPQKIWKIVQACGGRKYLSEPDGVRDWETKYSPFVVHCYYLDFDGTNFVRINRQFTIEVFEDSMPIAALQIMPLAVAERLMPGVNRAESRKRGEQFLTYRTPQYRYYQGNTLTRSPCGDQLSKNNEYDYGSHRLFTEQVESQVVIDFERCIQANPEWGPMSIEIDLWKSDSAEYHTVLADPNIDKDNIWDSRASEELLRLEDIKQQQWNRGDALPEEDDLLLLPGRVFAYVLRTRSWACLPLSADDKDHLTRVDRRTDAWDDLEIPSGHKLIVQALINTHFSRDKAKDPGFDLVREKGKGVIVLLHGVPGVGKTATAECVAVSHGKPLLPITCGDLGLKPKEVEATLQTAFQLAQAWDCVMLLDESDIFLAQRTNKDIERNALVSVFLRILEYYEGILFLTTNRIGAFDEAFKSRIHMALYYPPLNWPTTEKIWRNLIRRTLDSPMKVECSLDALITFARQLFEEQKKNNDPSHWNGRQIRNAFQSAIALARNENSGTHTSVKVEPRHFSAVAEVSNEFNNYLLRVKGGRTDADIAKEVQARDDNFNRAKFSQGPFLSQPQQFPAPAQTQMPMRQTASNVNQYQGFQMQQHVPQQQGTFTTATGSPYNSNQQVFYTTAQPPPQYNQPSQQPQYVQHLQALPVQQPQAAPASPGQQQFQLAQAQAGYPQQVQPGTQSGYTTSGAVDPSGPPPQGAHPGDPRTWQ